MVTAQFHEHFDASTVEMLARRLQAYAAELPPREQTILLALLHVAMPPLERIHQQGAEEILTAQEQQFLGQLREERR